LDWDRAGAPHWGISKPDELLGAETTAASLVHQFMMIVSCRRRKDADILRRH
jgi:hypothetical protein